MRVRRSAAMVGAWAACVAAMGQPGSGPPPAIVVLRPAKMEVIEQWRPVTGELRAARSTLLAAQEGGWVLEFGPREGDYVEAGAVIARLDEHSARLEMDRAEAAVKKWEAEVAGREADHEKARRDLEKREESMRRGAASETEIADARTLVTTAVARLDGARAELESSKADAGLARKRVGDLSIRSPFSGRVASRRTEVGQWVQRGEAVVEVMQLDTIEAWLDVPEAVVTRLERGLRAGAGGSGGSGEGAGVTVRVRVPALDEVREALVVAIVPAADPRSRLVPVRVLLRNPDELIKPGMSVTGLVPTGTPEASLTVPKDAILRNDAGTYVYFDGGGVAQVARVEVLFGAGESVAVRSDRLRAGMNVIVEGNERVYPGQPLAPAAEPGEGAAGSAGRAATAKQTRE